MLDWVISPRLYAGNRHLEAGAQLPVDEGAKQQNASSNDHDHNHHHKNEMAELSKASNSSFEWTKSIRDWYRSDIDGEAVDKVAREAALPPFVTDGSVTLIDKVVALVNEASNPFHAGSVCELLDAAVVTLFLAMNAFCRECPNQKHRDHFVTATEHVFSVALKLLPVHGSTADFKQHFLAAQLLRIPFRMYSKKVSLFSAEYKSQIGEQVLPTLLTVMDCVDNNYPDAVLSILEDDGRQKSEAALLACLLDLLTGLYWESTSKLTAHKKMLAARTDLWEPVHAAMVSCAREYGESKLTKPLARLGRFFKFCTVCVYGLSQDPDVDLHHQTYCNIVKPLFSTSCSPQAQPAIRAAAKLISTIVYNSRHVQEYFIRHQLPECLCSCFDALMDFQSADTDTLLSIFKALLNIVSFHERYRATIKTYLKKVTQCCAHWTEHLRLARIVTPNIYCISEQLSATPEPKLEEHMLSSISEYSKHVYAKLADAFRKETQIPGRGLWTMSLHEGADRLASWVFAAVRVSAMCSSWWFPTYWLGHSDDSIDTVLLDRLCRCGVSPEFLANSEDFASLTDESSALTYVRSVFIEYIKTLRNEKVSTDTIEVDGPMGFQLQHVFLTWWRSELETDDNIDENAMPNTFPDDQKILEWLSAVLPDTLPGPRCEDHDLQPTFDALKDGHANARVVRRSMCDRRSEIVVAAMKTTNRTTNDVQRIFEEVDVAKCPAKEGTKLWFHGCTGSDARKLLQQGDMNAADILTSRLKIHDIGAKRSFYLFEQFDDAYNHAESRFKLRGSGLPYPDTAPAVLIFEVPDKKLDESAHYIADSMDSSRACLFASRNAKVPGTLRDQQQIDNCKQRLRELLASMDPNTTEPQSVQLAELMQKCTDALDSKAWVFAHMYRSHSDDIAELTLHDASDIDLTGESNIQLNIDQKYTWAATKLRTPDLVAQLVLKQRDMFDLFSSHLAAVVLLQDRAEMQQQQYFEKCGEKYKTQKRAQRIYNTAEARPQKEQDGVASPEKYCAKRHRNKTTCRIKAHRN